MKDAPKLLFYLAILSIAWITQSVVAQDRAFHQEGYFNVRSATTVENGGVHELDARLQLLLSDEANDALTSGVPLRIELQLDLIRQRRFLPDAKEVELDQEYELEYRPLSQRYLVRDVNSDEQQSFATLYAALNNLGRVQGLPIVNDARLETDSNYRVRLRALLSTRQYPAPLRLLYFWRNQWQLESDWYEWELKR